MGQEVPVELVGKPVYKPANTGLDALGADIHHAGEVGVHGNAPPGVHGARATHARQPLHTGQPHAQPVLRCVESLNFTVPPVNYFKEPHPQEPPPVQRPVPLDTRVVQPVRDFAVHVVILFGAFRATESAHSFVVVRDLVPVSKGCSGPASASPVAQVPNGVPVHPETVVGVTGVLQRNHPIALPIAEGGADRGGLTLKELRGDVLFRRYRLTLTHPDKDNALQCDGGVFGGLQLAYHLGVWAFRDELHALTIAVEGRAVVGTAQVTLPEAITP